MTLAQITIYTDGACHGNGRDDAAGGWCAIVLKPEGRVELVGQERPTTNNRMELMAAISGLESLDSSSAVAVFTDSKYVKNGITQWIHNWKRRDWRTADREPVKNRDLWQRLELAVSRHRVQWHWVKGHASDELNNRADELAEGAAYQARRAQGA